LDQVEVVKLAAERLPPCIHGGGPHHLTVAVAQELQHVPELRRVAVDKDAASCPMDRVREACSPSKRNMLFSMTPRGLGWARKSKKWTKQGYFSNIGAWVRRKKKGAGPRKRVFSGGMMEKRRFLVWRG
jgi:hypothetical protein